MFRKLTTPCYDEIDAGGGAANTGVVDVAASEGIATPTGTPVSDPVQPEGQGAQQDITQTQAFARRLKEETAKAAQTARDSWIAEQGYQWNGKPITTEAEYRQALKEKEIEDSIRQQYETLPDEVLNELVETKKFREQYESDRRDSETRQKQQHQYEDFISEYPDISPEKIPMEVWDDVGKGKTLLDAYTRYENKSLRDQLSKFQTKEQAAAANQANAASSTGSVKGSGLPDSGFITQAEFEQHRTDQSWIMNNYDKLNKSRLKWSK